MPSTLLDYEKSQFACPLDVGELDYYFIGWSLALKLIPQQQNVWVGVKRIFVSYCSRITDSKNFFKFDLELKLISLTISFKQTHLIEVISISQREPQPDEFEFANKMASQESFEAMQHKIIHKIAGYNLMYDYKWWIPACVVVGQTKIVEQQNLLAAVSSLAPIEDMVLCSSNLTCSCSSCPLATAWSVSLCRSDLMCWILSA